MPPIAHPGRLLKRELEARALSANRLALDLGVPSGRITDILNGHRSFTADTAVRLGRYFGNSPKFWVDLCAFRRNAGTDCDGTVIDRCPGQAGHAGRYSLCF